MERITEITPLNEEFDFKTVPSWYVLCTNNACPLRLDCMRFCMRFFAGWQKKMKNCLVDSEKMPTFAN